MYACKGVFNPNILYFHQIPPRVCTLVLFIRNVDILYLEVFIEHRERMPVHTIEQTMKELLNHSTAQLNANRPSHTYKTIKRV